MSVRHLINPIPTKRDTSLKGVLMKDRFSDLILPAMVSSVRLGQCVRGQHGLYSIGKQLQKTVWLARYEVAANISVDPASHSPFSRTGSNQQVIIKSVRHFRVQNERDVFSRFQSQTPFIRPLIDEIVEPADPPAIVLKYLDDHLLNASISRRLTNQEIKYVARRILDALKVLYEDNFVHTGKCRYNLD